MQANEFDELLRARLEAYQPEYNPAAWEQLAAKIPTPPSRNRMLLPLAIGLAASVAGACIFMLRHVSPDHLETKTAMSTPSMQSNASLKQNAATNDNTDNSSAGGPSQVSNHIAAAITDKSTSHNDMNQSPLQPYVAPHASVVDTVTAVAAADKHKNVVVDPVAPGRNTGVRANMLEPIEPEEKPLRATTISLAGGVQYGTLNAGYAAGINVRHSVSKRWAVETEISYLNNGASGTQQLSAADYNNIPISGLVTNGPKIASMEEHHAPVQYLVASPSLGYKLVDGLTVWGGVDFQRALLAGDQKSVQIEDDEVKLLPTLDIGATGRAEFNISRHLQAGVLYRMGINNTLKSGSNYLERRYVQVQLKIPLIRK
jgi:hypothetical protein